MSEGESENSNRRNGTPADIFRKAMDEDDVALLRTALQMDSTLANQILTDKGGSRTRTPLMYVIKHEGSLELIQELLNHHADANARADTDFRWEEQFRRTALSLACRHDQLEVAKLLLKHGASVNARCKRNPNCNDCVTPLHMAVNAEMVRLLVSYGADVNSRSLCGTYPLQDAIKYGDLEMITILVEHGADIHATTPNGWTCLHSAASTGPVEIMQYLLRQGADATARANDGTTPLHNCGRFSLDHVLLLVQSGADVNARTTDGATPLHYCCHNVEVTRLLLQSGADVNARKTDGTTPLHNCWDNLEVTRLLLQSGADVNARTTEGTTPLHNCSDLEVTRLLLQHGAAVNARLTAGTTAFAYCKSVERAQLLLDNGADITIDGGRALNRATEHHNLALVRFLLELEIYPNARSLSGRTPLHAAFDKHCPKEMIMLLMESGADVNAREPDTGLSVLHRACRYGDVSLVEMLLEKGTDINSRDNEGWTPLLWAAGFSRWKIVKQLVHHGANINDCANVDSSSAMDVYDEVHLYARTPLSMACMECYELYYNDDFEDEYRWKGDVELLQDLVDAGACIDYRDKKGSTALLLTARNNYSECALWLIQRGADIHAQNGLHENETPFLTACEKGGLDMIYNMIRFSPHHQRPQPI